MDTILLAGRDGPSSQMSTNVGELHSRPRGLRRMVPVREHGVGGVPGGQEGGWAPVFEWPTFLAPWDKPGHYTGAIPGQEAHSDALM